MVKRKAARKKRPGPKKAASWRVKLGADVTTAVLDEASDDAANSDDAATNLAGDVFICAHGAGGNRNDPNTLALARAIAGRGLRVVRFDFFYAAKGRKSPDKMPKVMDCYAAVVERVQKELAPRRVFLGGRSMGGRASTMMAADGFTPCDALLLYAYPLHPPGAPDKLRVEHLPRIKVPVLCFNGTRDDFCTPSIMDATVASLRASGVQWRHEWIDDADHSFHVRKASGTDDAAVVARVAATTVDFVRSLAR